ncbi:uncharacterized protein LOC133817500 [Humulus lupulus]|uniref:uncharacterized protein LOC133817500 n=1 Tax=Humulus lupulus TaxID=3486 RepID=UPI002B414D71|nr:uncharacterized protein LOC133817500 [Humulus lupulus]
MPTSWSREVVAGSYILQWFGGGGDTRAIIDATSVEVFMRKRANETYELLEELVMDNYNWSTERENKKVVRVLEVDPIALLTARVASLTKQLQQNNLIAQAMQALVIGNFSRPTPNTYSNSYTPVWKNHHNLSRKNNKGLQPQYPQYSPQQPPHQLTYGLHSRPYYDPNPRPSHPPPHPPMNSPTMHPYQINQFMTETRSSIRNLETQMGQLAKLLSSRQQGNFPSSTEVNPKEQCQAVTLRSGTKYDGPTMDNKGKKIEDQHVTSPAQDEVTEDLPKKEKPKHIEPTPKIPYPQWFWKANLDKIFSKILEVFKKLHINIPFAEALEKMPSYVKFMKEILYNKRKIEDYETIALIEECSAIIQKKLPQKLRDPGIFTIPCTIGNFHCERALFDLGARINLMSLSVFKRLGLGEARPTTVTLQLADCPVTHSRGIIEDVIVKVDKFIFPADFIVLDMEEDEDVPIILG